MKKRMMVVFMLVVVSAVFVSAQQNPLKKRMKKLNKVTKPQVDFSIEPKLAPVDELDVNEFQLKRKELQGKVIELEFDRVVSLKQVGEGYTAKVTFKDPRDSTGVFLIIPEEGLALFEEYTKNDARYRHKEKVYVEVLSNVVRVVGTHYNKNKDEGERYSW